MSDLGSMKSAKRKARYERSQKGRKGTWGHRFRVVERIDADGKPFKANYHPTNGTLKALQ